MRASMVCAAIALLACSSLVIAAPAKTVKTEIKTKGYSFEYSYPATVNTHPKLRQTIEKDKAAQLKELQALAREMSRDTDRPFANMAVETSVAWETVTDLPAYLSLTMDNWSYTGAAHGNWWRTSQVWDKKAAKSLDPFDFFTSKAAFDELVQTSYCDLLDIERSKRRDGEKVDRSQTDDWMQACPKPSELVLILGSSNGKAFNRLSVYASPYAVGPYVEGDYEVDLPMTAALIAAVKLQYRGAFTVTPK